jgi:hypothetical protein
MYKLFLRKRSSKNWKQKLFGKTVNYAKNGLIKTHKQAVFLAELYQNELYKTRIVKINWYNKIIFLL